MLSSYLTCSLWPGSLKALCWRWLHSAISLLLLAQLLHQYLCIDLPRDTDTVSQTSTAHEPRTIKGLIVSWQQHSEAWPASLHTDLELPGQKRQH